ncbi:MAG TPA: DUF423 domain-containing protein [Flavobacteriaceae bacterium]|jgi:uncharacterized membrane protein YgdD (TMEM256/DUF423 family)|nr:DUF423 domain-containing protein [Flavobacteriaceae bacterium]|tara:strand:+ start:127300 stop:127692 length:393 start_codon:yes stop_codon:yes gene_type:complete
MRDYNKNIVVTASILAAITIAIGAFGAHGLKQLVDAKSVATFENGVRYQMYHCLALLVVGFAKPISENTKKWVFRFFLFGIIFFSGSIYLLALKEVLPFNVSFLGPITPIGGLFFIVGWLWLARGLYSLK